jgi:hypothetical protein
MVAACVPAGGNYMHQQLPSLHAACVWEELQGCGCWHMLVQGTCNGKCAAAPQANAVTARLYLLAYAGRVVLL